MKVTQYFINTKTLKVVEKRRYARLCSGENPWEIEISLTSETKNSPHCMGITIDYESMKKFIEKAERQKVKDVA